VEPGFFGKVRSHGDFVGRRLPPEVRDCFDRWLQAGLVRSKEDLGDEWLPVWLSSPLWRFVVAAGVCGEQAWAGVMMPSHDRVGRCFPLLLMAGVDGTPSLHDCLGVHEGWFGKLEALALSTLEEDFALESFDAALLALEGAPPACGSSGEPAAAGWASIQGLSATLGSALPALRLGEGQSALWSEGSERIAPSLAVCDGLPAPGPFTALLDGGWMRRGWPA
jgi:type VI secretion system protein ImpM